MKIRKVDSKSVILHEGSNVTLKTCGNSREVQVTAGIILIAGKDIKYRYDAHGNRIEKSKTGELVVRYTYNEANQLQGVENGTTQVTVGYDSFGNRIHTNVTVDGVVKRSETYLIDPLGDAGEIPNRQ